MVKAPGSSPEMAYVDSPPTAVPPEASYEEDWEVFDPWVQHCIMLKSLLLQLDKKVQMRILRKQRVVGWFNQGQDWW